MSGGGKKQMVEKGYSKAEVFQDPLLAIQVVALKLLSDMAAGISPRRR